MRGRHQLSQWLVSLTPSKTDPELCLLGDSNSDQVDNDGMGETRKARLSLSLLFRECQLADNPPPLKYI